MSLISSSSSSSVAVPSDALSTGVRDSYLEQLANLSQCSDSKCTFTSCVQFKKDLHKLEGALRKGPGYLDLMNMVTLRLLHEHYTYPCSLPNCRVPWCRVMSYRCLRSLENTQQELMALLNQPMLTLLPPETKFDEFIRLDPELSCEGVEWEEWLTIAPLSHSYMVALAVPLNRNEHQTHWVVKMRASPHSGSSICAPPKLSNHDLEDSFCLCKTLCPNETAHQEEDNQLLMLKKLRGLQHPHIISHVWAASCSHVLVLCTEYMPGVSVRDMLDEVKSLSYTRARFYFLQALSAAQRLHELNITFLNWKCSNLLLDDRRQTLKVSNFGTSIDLSTTNADIGTIRFTLPADIVPAELIRGESVTHRTDSWGLACMMHEMVAGVRPWHHLRHQSQEDIWKQILTQAPPEVSSSLPECVRVLVHTCLQRPSDSRPSVKEMMDHLHAELE